MPTNQNPNAQFQQRAPNPGGPGNPMGVYNTGGQQPGLGRYVPPTLAGDGSNPNYWNQNNGPYSYNVPNSFGGYGYSISGSFPLIGTPGYGQRQGGGGRPPGPPQQAQGTGSTSPVGGTGGAPTTTPNGNRYVTGADGVQRFVGRAPAPQPSAPGGQQGTGPFTTAGSSQGGSDARTRPVTGANTPRTGVAGSGSFGPIGNRGNVGGSTGGGYNNRGPRPYSGSSNYDNQTGNRTVEVGSSGGGGSWWRGPARAALEAGAEITRTGPESLFGIPTPYSLLGRAAQWASDRIGAGGGGDIPIEIQLNEPSLSGANLNPGDFQQNPWGDPTEGMVDVGEDPFVGPPEAGGRGSSWSGRGGIPIGGAHINTFAGPNASAAARRSNMITGGYGTGGGRLSLDANGRGAFRQGTGNYDINSRLIRTR